MLVRLPTWNHLLLLVGLFATPAFAEPVDMLDATPRWIDVAFEVSPRDMPAQTDTVYTRTIPARLEVGEMPGQIVVTIGAEHVERVLFADDDPVPGSFSDYVWVFDAASGEVLSASLAGRLTQKLDWGFFETRSRMRIATDLVTGRIGGVSRSRSWLGQEIFEFCDDSADASCRLVAGRGYDPATGYVYAVGALEVKFSEVTLRTFSPLGEAVFSERAPDRADAQVVSGRRPTGYAPVAAVGALAAPKLVPAVSSGPPHN